MNISPAEIVYNLLEDLNLIGTVLVDTCVLYTTSTGLSFVPVGDDGYCVLTKAAGEEWEAFIGFMPDMPMDCIGVFDTQGTTDGRLMSGQQIEHQGIQIQVRGPSHKTAWHRVQAITAALDIQFNVSVAGESGATYLVINVSRKGAIIPTGVDVKDGKRRHYFTINATVTFREEL